MMLPRLLRTSAGLVSVWLLVVLSACETAPTVTPPAPASFDQKVSWILRLEHQRILRDPPVPGNPGPTAPREDPGVEADLLALLGDPEPQLRRRAALALGRIGDDQGVLPLSEALRDPQVEVRQMAAFALGLIGNREATPVLLTALDDPEPVVQGRAAEALGRLGASESADAIGGLLERHLTSTFQVDPEDLSYPLSPEVEAFRLGLYALAELGSYEPMARVLLSDGQPVLWWWPVAYALQRVGDARAVEALATLAGVQGSLTVAFAAQGLGALGGPETPAAVDALVALLDRNRQDDRVVATAVRALGGLDHPRAAGALYELAVTRDLPRLLRLEAVEALGRQAFTEARDLFVELATARWPPLRAAALRALARADPDAFLLVLSGLRGDDDWRVRAALAEGLAFVSPEAAEFPLQRLLADPDQRVVPAVLRTLSTLRGSDAESVLVEHLRREDVVVRGTAAQQLATLARSADLDAATIAALVDALDAAASDSSYLARAAIVEALVVTDPGHDALRRALNDQDWAVRIRTARLLGEHFPDRRLLEEIRPAPVRRRLDFAAPHLVRPTVSPRVYIETEQGNIELELDVINAPITADNFVVLARRGFYDGLLFHRVVPNYVVQGGDPRGDSQGGPGHTLRDEVSQHPFLRGTVGMALDWADTAGSQFFITYSPQPQLDARYTAFARVVSGMEVVDQLEPGAEIRRVLVWDGVAPLGSSASNRQ